MSKIEDFLKSLGNTSEEVANTLEAMGINGEKSNPTFCPIIKSIYNEFPNLSKGLKVEILYRSAGYVNLGCYGKVWMNSSYSVVITWDDIQTMDPLCPEAVQQFVLDFDKGKYPNLVGKSETLTKKEVLTKLSNILTKEERMVLGI